MHGEHVLENQEKENLEALEEFWRNKGFQEGEKKGFDVGLKEGEEQGHRKGVEEGKSQGFEEGKEVAFNEGLEKGCQDAKAEIGEVFELINNIAQQLSDEKNMLLEKFKPEIVKLAMAVCENILRQELQMPQRLAQLVGAIVKDAKSLASEEKISVLFAPDDLQKIEKIKHDLQGNMNMSQMKFLSDTSLSAGNFRVEAPTGMINFDIKRLLDDMQTSILEVNAVQNEIIEEIEKDLADIT